VALDGADGNGTRQHTVLVYWCSHLVQRLCPRGYRCWTTGSRSRKGRPPWDRPLISDPSSSLLLLSSLNCWAFSLASCMHVDRVPSLYLLRHRCLVAFNRCTDCNEVRVQARLGHCPSWARLPTTVYHATSWETDHTHLFTSNAGRTDWLGRFIPDGGWVQSRPVRSLFRGWLLALGYRVSRFGGPTKRRRRRRRRRSVSMGLMTIDWRAMPNSS